MLHVVNDEDGKKYVIAQVACKEKGKESDLPHITTLFFFIAKQTNEFTFQF